MACKKVLCQISPRNLIINSRIIARLSSSGGEADWVPKEVKIHTGQEWESEDYRNARFVNTPKHTNKNWAINLIAEVPPKECKERVVWCDGGGGPTGHPRVYINLDIPGNHDCVYCGLRFTKKGHH